MACEHDKAELLLLVYGEAGPEAEALERRLAGCAACRQELEELGQAALLLEALPRESAPAAVLAGLQPALELRQTEGRLARLARRRAPAWLAPLAVAATLLIGLIGGTLLRHARPGAVPAAAATPRGTADADLMAWQPGLDRRLDTLDRKLDTLLAGLASARRDEEPDLDQKLDRLETRIADLVHASNWGQDPAGL